MYLVGSPGQQQIHDVFDASGQIASGGTAQLCIPQRKSCSLIHIINTSAAILSVQIGIRPATATLTSGSVTSVAVGDAGFGFLVPPTVAFLGGGNSMDLASQGATMPHWPAPANAATGYATLSSGSISAITVTNGGSGYTKTPYVYVLADRTDPTGVGLCNASVGIVLAASGNAGSQLFLNYTSCPTTAISIWGGSTGQTYTAKWMP